MCGIAGIYSNQPQAANCSEMMINAIRHRGPDSHGTWSDPEVGIYLAHARLSIQDLTSAGNQPMKSRSGRFLVVFNGEIYNHRKLRKELEIVNAGVSWRGYSDTETFLAGFEHWGIEQTVKKTIGMFAFAVWDKKYRKLVLGRDRLGEKPLYYGWQNNMFVFASELSAIKAHPAFKAEINRDALTLLLRHNCIPAPHSIFKGIKKLLPGCLVTLSSCENEAHPVHYWDPVNVIANSQATPFSGTPHEAVDELESLLKDAVKKQLLSDVPLGAFLSGGVDSSLVVAMMQTQSNIPVNTFSLGFNIAAYDEAKHAKAVAAHLKTNHTELYVSAQMARDIIPRLPELYCEPFSDASQIPTFLVSQLARQHVTVSLSGDGGDELFGGYNRYVLSEKIWGRLSTLPVGLRSVLASSLTGVSPRMWNKLLGPIQKVLPEGLAQANIGEKLHKGAGVMTLKSLLEVHRHLASHWKNPEEIVIGGKEPLTLLTMPDKQPQTDNPIHQMMALDLLTYLPDDILCKVDRAAMAVSLETRVPLFDYRVVEFAWRLPLDYKLRDGVGKWVLRQVLYKYIPKNLIERPKMGFGIPIGDWLRGPLREWAEDLLSESRLKREGFFKPDPIQKKLREHMSGDFNWQYHLWSVLMFQAWLAEN